jgi:hypothetical protein
VIQVLDGLKRRRDARRWQRWTENDPEDELESRARIGGIAALIFFGLVVALVIVGLVVAR